VLVDAHEASFAGIQPAGAVQIRFHFVFGSLFAYGFEPFLTVFGDNPLCLAILQIFFRLLRKFT
jgi:hypothetical protein